MEGKDAILIMIAFSTFVVALLTYIANNQEKVKTHPKVDRRRWVFVPFINLKGHPVQANCIGRVFAALGLSNAILT
ncbi:hypothetical protein SD70_14320 [Gordoniibacillus kamchatkensis]|uniref:Uncharacterized protein n=1 Tax=Gordoniibacillus kamchatkensis TaxID=1590651 RepID=A0ABR5AGU9_9BACL|nr:putative holin-like toxin [Paenibacillus sp. VKM B-2647]KIL40276.1 hypothetical protein SD70_14320 [Paenibacillus sp. VKM B-2647]